MAYNPRVHQAVSSRHGEQSGLAGSLLLMCTSVTVLARAADEATTCSCHTCIVMGVEVQLPAHRFLESKKALAEALMCVMLKRPAAV